jgi:hypothetical protein
MGGLVALLYALILALSMVTQVTGVITSQGMQGPEVSAGQTHRKINSLET